MKSKIINTALRGFLLSVSCFISSASATLIFEEDFTGGSVALQNSQFVTWSDSDGGGFEVYNANGAGARGMSGFYDHDNNPNTPDLALPGGLEVNDDSGNVFLTATFNLNSGLGANQSGFLTFYGGVRGGNSTGASIEIFNLTQNTSISGVLTPTLGAFDWVYNEFSFASTAVNIGDQIQFRWQGGGNSSANGQEVALVSFSIVDDTAVVPEPSTLAIFALGIIGLASRRFKVKA